MKIKYLDEELYVTTDISLTAAITMKFSIKSINRENPKRILFIFEKDKNLQEYIEKYWNGELKVEPLKFFQCLKTLKGRIYNND